MPLIPIRCGSLRLSGIEDCCGEIGRQNRKDCHTLEVYAGGSVCADRRKEMIEE